ncbi:uncharacterized protein LOC101458151 [Ceratitis capitata]|uniref:uncharacterized protein LOC101458151 n=1 Tax=Ceratitis capitata TaxID=7213 RepID=UPI00061881DE|nr:uncharacterized protein LOC101458151 [Ceratitis capitata]
MFRYCVCFSLLALAAAQSGGYNYASASVPEPQVYAAPSGPAPGVLSVAPEPEYAATPVAAASQQYSQQAAPVYRKDFYYFSAPKETVAQRPVALASQPVPTVVKKHLNVIFIQAPESTSRKSHYQPVRNAVPHVSEETKTHIYVLNKAAGRSAPRPAASQQHVTTYKSHQPEVHHLKYSTPAEAQQLQQQIVQQYGGGNVIEIGGHEAASNVNRQYLAPAASNVNNQYFAPAASNVNNQYLAPAVEAAAASAPEPSNAYIPPSLFFKH